MGSAVKDVEQFQPETRILTESEFFFPQQAPQMGIKDMNDAGQAAVFSGLVKSFPR